MHRLLVIAAAGLAALVGSGPAGAWSWPADGDVLRPFTLGGDAYAAGQHRGIDVVGVEGSPVRSPASGTVSFAGTLPTYGRGVTILTADGYAVTLVHLGSIGVAKGDTVAEGASIGSMGWSGDPEHDVPTVHLGVRVETQGEGYVDPLGLLPPRSAAPAPSPPTAAPAPAPAPAQAPAPAVPRPSLRRRPRSRPSRSLRRQPPRRRRSEATLRAPPRLRPLRLRVRRLEGSCRRFRHRRASRRSKAKPLLRSRPPRPRHSVSTRGP